jgi:hypothetical protein
MIYLQVRLILSESPSHKDSHSKLTIPLVSSFEPAPSIINIDDFQTPNCKKHKKHEEGGVGGLL